MYIYIYILVLFFTSGWFPGPVAVGQVIDTRCRLWSESCEKTGACSLFDIVDFRYKRHGLDLGVRVLAFIIFFSSFVCARRRADLRKERNINIELKIEPPEVEILITKIDKK
jgi:organic anion transporter 3A